MRIPPQLLGSTSAIVDASADEDDWGNRSATFKEAYQRWFPDGLLGPLIENAEKSELTGLFFATLGYVRYVGRESEPTKAETVFAGLEAKGWADDRLTGYMHNHHQCNNMYLFHY